MVELCLAAGPAGEAVGRAGAHEVLRYGLGSGEGGFFGETRKSGNRTVDNQRLDFDWLVNCSNLVFGNNFSMPWTHQEECALLCV